MSVNYRVDSARNLIRYTVTGPMVVDEIMNMVFEAMTHIDRSRPLNDIWDLTEMTALEGESQDIERLARRWATLGPIRRPPGKAALVATTPYQYGVARMYISWLGDQLNWESRLFKNEADALAWLDED